MRRILTAIVVATVLAFGLFGGSAVAADREQMTITELSLGVTPTKITETMISNIVSGVLNGTGSTLSVTGTLTSAGNANFTGTRVAITNNLDVGKNLTVTGTVTVVGDAVLPAGSIGSAELATAVQNKLLTSLSAGIVANANGGTNVVTVTMKDLNGATLATNCLFRFWISDTVYGVLAAVAGDIAISGTGAVEVQQVVDKADYWVMASAGSAVITVTDTPGGTNFINFVSGGGIVTASNMVFNVP